MRTYIAEHFGMPYTQDESYYCWTRNRMRRSIWG